MAKRSDWVKIGGGFLLGSVGLTILGSKPAQKLYTHLTAGVYLAKDYIMEKAEVVQTAASDISEDANVIRENVIREKYHQEKDDDFDMGMDAAEETVSAEVVEE